jgi:hypothetical protein
MKLRVSRFVQLETDSAGVSECESRGRAVSTTRWRIVRSGRNIEIRPLGGLPGCLAMILVSIIASVVLTLVVNLVLR